MLDEFTIQDLPFGNATIVPLSHPVSMAADSLVRLGGKHVIVTAGDGALHSVVKAEAVQDLAKKAPAVPVGRLPSIAVQQVEPSLSLTEAMRRFTDAKLGALAMKVRYGWRVIIREDLYGITSWDSLAVAREARLCSPSGIR